MLHNKEMKMFTLAELKVQPGDVVAFVFSTGELDYYTVYPNQFLKNNNSDHFARYPYWDDARRFVRASVDLEKDIEGVL